MRPTLHKLLVVLAAAAVWAPLRDARASEFIETTPEQAPEIPPGYFYKGQDYGSESQFNPLTVLMNGGFDILRNLSYQDDLRKVDYATGLKNVGRNLANPIDGIRDGGFARLVAHEVFPYRGLDSKYGQFVPNWTLHFLGEAMLARKVEEWYRYNDVPGARVLGLLTVSTMQLMNEVAENGSYEGTNTDPVVDMYFFNLLGHVLFSSDAVMEFFSGPVKMNFWAGQAVLDMRTFEIYNQGENMSLKISLGDWTDWRGFAYFGCEGLFGVSAPLTQRDTLSMGAGPRLLELTESADRGSRILVPAGEMNLSTGVFWDRDESLMASLLVGGPANPSVALNVYPGVINVMGYTFGVYALAAKYEGLAAGITLRNVPIMPGTAFNRDRSPAVY